MAVKPQTNGVGYVHRRNEWRMTDVISKELLDILVCPEDRTPLALAETALVDRLNHQIDKGVLINRSGQTVEDHLNHGLIRQDEKILYPVVDGIPILLVDQAIDIENLNE